MTSTATLTSVAASGTAGPPCTAAGHLSQLCEELEPIAEALLADGFRIFFHYGSDDRRRHSRSTWIIASRASESDPLSHNVGVIDYNHLDGFRVGFAIKPSPETGSSIDVALGVRPSSIGRLVEAARTATSDRLRGLPNHGWEHFTWALPHLLQIHSEGALR